MCYHSGPEWTWERWQWTCNLHSPKLQHYWNLTIRLFRVISRTLFERVVLPLCREAVGVFYTPYPLGKHVWNSGGYNCFLSILRIIPWWRAFFTFYIQGSLVEGQVVVVAFFYWRVNSSFSLSVISCCVFLIHFAFFLPPG